MDQKFFRVPFAVSGDKNNIPTAAPGDGSISYASGWGPDYAKDRSVDPSAKSIARADMNGVLSDITTALQQYQTTGAPEFITAADNGGVAFPYEFLAEVRWRPDGASPWGLYVSLVSNNTSDPSDSTKWATLDPRSKLNVSGGTITGGLTVNESVSVAATQANGGVEIGPPGIAGTPFIDFHSSGGAARDYDARIVVSGGNSGVDGQATLTVSASNVVLNSNARTEGVHVFGIEAGSGTISADANQVYFYGNKGASVGTGSAFDLSFVTNNIARGKINSAGRWLIGGAVDNGNDTLQVQGNLRVNSGVAYLGNVGGSLYAGSDATQGWVYGQGNAFFGTVGSAGKSVNLVTNGQVRLAASDTDIDALNKLNALKGLTVKRAGAEPFLSIDADAGFASYLTWLRAGVTRWATYFNPTSGDLLSNRYNASGGFIDTPFLIAASTGRCHFSHTVMADNAINEDKIYVNGYGSGQGLGILFRAGLAGLQTVALFTNASGAGVGSITSNDTSTGYNTASDYRLKQNYKPIVGALASLRRMRMYSGEFIAEPGTQYEYAIAHELQEEVPRAVHGEKDATNEDGSIKPQGVDYSKLVPRMIAAMQEMADTIDTLRAEVAALKGAN